MSVQLTSQFRAGAGLITWLCHRYVRTYERVMTGRHPRAALMSSIRPQARPAAPSRHARHNPRESSNDQPVTRLSSGHMPKSDARLTDRPPRA